MFLEEYTYTAVDAGAGAEAKAGAGEGAAAGLKNSKPASKEYEMLFLFP